MQIISHSLADTKKAATEVLLVLKRYKVGGAKAIVVGLKGDLGSGKTTFSQSIAEVLGVIEQVTSPTFVIEKIYTAKDSDFKKFVHIDAYRLEDGHELNVLDFKRLIEDEQNLIFIEWPERVADILPLDTFYISFTFVDENTRMISYEDSIK